METEVTGMLLELDGAGEDLATDHDRRARRVFATPGVASAARFSVVEGGHRTLLAYELDDVEGVRTRLGTGGSPRGIDRRFYASLGTDSINDGYALERCTHLLAVLQSVAHADEEEFNAWYDQEHVPMLAAVPGWLRSRRFSRVGGDGPDFLAYHELASTDVFEDPAFAAARATPWRATVVGYRIDYESRLCVLQRRH